MFKELNVVYYCIETAKWSEAKRFYEEILGLKQSFGSDEIGWIEYKVDPAHTTALAISLLGEDQQVTQGGGGTAVFIVDDIEEVVNELRRQEVSFIGDIYSDEMLKLIKFEDPCGNQLQLVEVLA